MPLDQQVLDYYGSHQDDFLEGLKALLRIPSISAMSEHKPDILKAANFLADDLTAMGLQGVRLVEGKGHPMIYGEWLEQPGKPTLLLYGHYDVQPPDPLDEWVSPPFEPTVRGDNLYARGAVDDKGQTWLILKALEGHLKATGKLPINVKVLIEGEEEVDGGMIAAYVEERGKDLGADAALICDTEMFAPGLPTLTTGLRGIIYTEISVQAARTDLHSGMYGGVAPNPLQAMAEILTGLKDAEGRLLIPGIYESVDEPSAAEKEAWASLPFDEAEMLAAEIGSSSLVGEPNRTALERIWSRPTLEVHGIRGGFVGEGAKTVIPAKALAKVSMRLVPGMDPKKTAQALVERVKALEPAGCHVTTTVLAASAASLTSTDSPFMVKAAQALEQTFDKKAVFTRSGGSIPVVGLFQRFAGIPSVLMGFGLPDDNLHAPNEKFHIPNLYSGIEAVGRYLTLLGE